MSKFNPHYELRITYPYQGTIVETVIKDPVSIKFNVEKSTFSDTNITKITVYNMDLKTRTAIYQDNLLFNDQIPKKVTLAAGYGENLTVISFGYIQQCYTTRQGVDVITEIIVIDPDILTCYTSKTFAAGSEKKDAYLNMLRDNLPNVSVGAGVDNVAGTFQIDTVFEGNSFILINQLTGDHTFIDDGVLHTLYENQTISNYGVYYIAAETGLLGTPIRQDARLQIKMLFEPTIRLGQLVEIKSETFSDEYRFDGQYKVIGLSHDCSISNAEGGTRITTLTLNYQEYLDMANVAFTGSTQSPQTTKFENGKEIPVFGSVSKNDEGICRYIKTHNGDVPTGADGKINNHISWKEMLYTDNNLKSDVVTEISPQIIANCRLIANRLADFCAVRFPNKKIILNSGYRTKRTNSRIEKAANNSLHKSGNAIDFHLQGVSNSELTKIFKAYWKYGLGTYNWGLHVSNKQSERFKGR